MPGLAVLALAVCGPQPAMPVAGTVARAISSPTQTGTLLVRVEPPDGPAMEIEVELQGRPGTTNTYSAKTSVDGAGIARFESVPIGKVRLQVRARRLLNRRRTIHIAPGENSVRVRLRALDRPFGHVSGVVADSEDRPVSGLNIRLIPWAGTPPDHSRTRGTSTGLDGTFVFPFLDEANYRVEAGGADLGFVVDDLRVRAREEINVEWIARPGTMVSGSIRKTNPDGLDWKIVATSLAHRSSSEEVLVSLRGGEFVTRLQPGAWLLAAVRELGSPRRGRETVPLGTVSVGPDEGVRAEFEWEPPPRVSFETVILDRGAPAAGLSVELVPAYLVDGDRYRPDDPTYVRTGPFATAVTDDLGRASFAGVHPGEGVLMIRFRPGQEGLDRASVPNSPAATAARPITGEQFEPDVRAVALVTRRVRVPDDDGIVVDVSTIQIEGRVVDREGRPVTMQRRGSASLERDGCWSHDLACYVRLKGARFRLPPRLPGPVRMHVARDGYLARVVDFDIDAQRSAEPLVVVLDREHELAVDVRYPTRPSSRTVHFKLCADPECVTVVLEDWMGRRGRLHRPYEGVPEGDWWLTLWSGYERVGPVPLALPGPPPVVQLTSELGRVTAWIPDLYGSGQQSTMRLLGADDIPVAVDDHCGFGKRDAWSGKEGRIIAYCVPPGRYRVRVVSEDGRAWSRNVHVRTYRRGEVFLRARHQTAPRSMRTRGQAR